MRFIDLFAGIGGFRLGFEQAGLQCVFSAENNTQCQQVYYENFNERPFGDITAVNANEIPNFEVLLAGFPCQPFSISGKKLGFLDTRGTLFFEVCKIIKAKAPKVVVLENVKHLIHHDKGKTLEVILYSLEELGYEISHNIVNTKDFGLPQNRERIFIVGTLNGTFNFNGIKLRSTPDLREFLDREGDFETLKKSEYTLIESPRIQPLSRLFFVGYRNKNTWKVGIRPNTEHLSRVHRQPNRIYSIDGFHPTLPSQETSGRFFIYIPEKDLVRKLTIGECYRLMGFPEYYKKHPTVGERYKQIGNAVSPPVAFEIANAILSQGLLDKTKRCINEPQRKTIRRQQATVFD